MKLNNGSHRKKSKRCKDYVNFPNGSMNENPTPLVENRKMRKLELRTDSVSPENLESIVNCFGAKSITLNRLRKKGKVSVYNLSFKSGKRARRSMETFIEIDGRHLITKHIFEDLTEHTKATNTIERVGKESEVTKPNRKKLKMESEALAECDPDGEDDEAECDQDDEDKPDQNGEDDEAECDEDGEDKDECDEDGEDECDEDEDEDECDQNDEEKDGDDYVDDDGSSESDIDDDDDGSSESDIDDDDDIEDDIDDLEDEIGEEIFCEIYALTGS